MKKKVLFISKEFYPASNGTIACIENILPYLGKEYSVELFCANSSGDSSQKELNFNVQINRAYHKSDMGVLKKQEELAALKRDLHEIRAKNGWKLWIKIKYFWVQKIADRYGYIQPDAFEKNIIKYIEKHINVANVEYVIAVGAPFENIRVAVTLKKRYPNMKLALLMFDLYTYNPVYLLEDKSLSDFEKRMREEQFWISYADIIISASETKEQWSKSKLDGVEKKLTFLNIPSFQMREESLSSDNELGKDSKVINCVYSGTLYNDIRNPRFMLTVFNRLIMVCPNIVIHILGTGCEEIISEYKEKMGDHLCVYGQRDRQYSQNVLEKADFLLSIGNHTTTQLPSKIFEYIATGKPIIHIYSINNDTCLSYLQRYPLKYCIKEDCSNIDEEVKKMLDFIVCSRSLRCNIAELKDKYVESTPKYYAEKLIELLEE